MQAIRSPHWATTARVLCCVLFLASGAYAFNPPTIDVARCRVQLAQLALTSAAYRPLATAPFAEQRKFIDEVLLPVTGLRLLSLDKHTERPFRIVGSSIIFSDFRDTAFKDADPTPSKNVRISWVNDRTEPEIVHLDDEVHLLVPHGYDFSALPDGGARWIRGLLMGHPLQPYIFSPKARAEREALHEPPILLKGGQVEGVRAVHEAIARGDRHFLYVAPTAYGKTEVLKEMLAMQNANSSGAGVKLKLHIVNAHDKDLVKQLYDDVAELQKETGRAPFVIKRWGGTEGAQEIEDLLKEVDASPVPVVLVTTIQSLRERVHQDVKGNPELSAANRAKNIVALKKYLATLGFDEAHRAGADQSEDLVEDLMEDSQVFLYGTTATPTHKEVQIIKKLWQGHAFFAGLDTAPSYAASRGAGRRRIADIGAGAGSSDRTIEDVIDQLSAATANYEVTPVRGYLFLDPEKVKEAGPDVDLWIRDKKEKPKGDTAAAKGKDEETGRYRMNPLHYPNFLATMRPLIEDHTLTFITATSIAEANDLAKAIDEFQTEKPGKKKLRIGVLHSALHENPVTSAAMQADVLEKAKRGEYDVILSVGMLDEGKNIPALDFYIDMNRNPQIKQQLQRLGRLLRLSPHKEGVDFATFVDVDADEGAERLALVEAVATGRLGGGAGSGPGQKSIPLKTGPRVHWDYPELRQKFERKPFFGKQQREETSGSEEADQLLKFIEARRKYGIRLPNAFVDFNERAAEESFHKYVDQTVEEGGPRRRAFFTRLAKAPKDVQDLIEAYVEQRDRDRQKLCNPQGTAEVVNAFVARHKGLPRSANTTKRSEKGSSDEDRLKATMDSFRDHAAFLSTLNRSALDQLNITQKDTWSSLFLRKWQDDGKVNQWLGEFVSSHGYLPRDNGNAFEKQLHKVIIAAKTPAQREVFPPHVREAIERPEREAAERTRLEAEKRAAEKAERKAAASSAPAPSVAVEKKATLPKNLPPKPLMPDALVGRLEEHLRLEVEKATKAKNYVLLAQLANLSGSLVQYETSVRAYNEGVKDVDLVKVTEASARGRQAILDIGLGILPKPVEPNEVTMTLFPAKRDDRNLPRAQALADFYVQAINAHTKARGWTARITSGPKESKVTVQISGVGVRQYLATEQGEHTIQYKQSGATFTNPVGVNMAPTVVALTPIGRVYRLSDRDELTVGGEKPDLDAIAREALLDRLEKFLPK